MTFRRTEFTVRDAVMRVGAHVRVVTVGHRRQGHTAIVVALGGAVATLAFDIEQGSGRENWIVDALEVIG